MWKIDSTHSVVEFKVRHMMISNLKGQFSGVTGTLWPNEADLTQSSVEASIEIASIHTRHEDREAHLKGADFFDAEKSPTMHLKSTHNRAKGGRGTCGYRKSDDQGRYPQREIRRGGTVAGDEGSLG